VTVSDTGIGIAQQQRAWQGKARRSASGEFLDGPVLRTRTSTSQFDPLRPVEDLRSRRSPKKVICTGERR
jgi:hypothetical protein